MQGSDDLPLAGERRRQRGVGFAERSALLGQAEVEQFDSLLGDQNIGRLQVAMGDALSMRGIESIENLAGVFDGLLQRKRTIQRRALNKLHYQIIGADIVELADVRMIQRGHRARFALEPFRKLLAGNLDGDRAVEARVARLVHFPHAARANEREDLIGTELRAGREGHSNVSFRFYPKNGI